ncbi:MAG: RsfS/YbeB/iojap family protein, partial [Pseudomonadota bacterium]
MSTRCRHVERHPTLSTLIERAGSASVESIQARLSAIIETLEDDKAEELTVIDLEGKSSIADHMIIA